MVRASARQGNHPGRFQAGGVILADAPGEFHNVTYRADISSGDLYPEFADN